MNGQFVALTRVWHTQYPEVSWYESRGFPDCATLSDIWAWSRSQIPAEHWGELIICEDQDPSIKEP